MARARSFVNVTACRAVSNSAWCRIFREILCFSPLNIGALFRWCVLGQGTLPSHASLDSGVNEYLVGQRWQCVRLVPSAEMAASAVCSKKGVEMVHEWTGPVTRGNMCEAQRALYVRYIRTHHYYYFSNSSFNWLKSRTTLWKLLNCLLEKWRATEINEWRDWRQCRSNDSMINHTYSPFNRRCGIYWVFHSIINTFSTAF